MSLEVIEEYRGISVETLEQYGIEWVEDDDYAVRVPYYNYNGTWYDRKLLDPRLDPKGRPKVLSPPNANRHLYNPMRLGPNADLVIFCEGEYDTLSVLDVGFPAVGIQGAKTFRGLWARLFEGAVNVISFDGDSAGKEAAHDVRRIFGKLGNHAYVLELDEGEDLNDLHQQGILGETLELFLEENELTYG